MEGETEGWRGRQRGGGGDGGVERETEGWRGRRRGGGGDGRGGGGDGGVEGETEGWRGRRRGGGGDGGVEGETEGWRGERGGEGRGRQRVEGRDGRVERGDRWVEGVEKEGCIHYPCQVTTVRMAYCVGRKSPQHDWSQASEQSCGAFCPDLKGN